MLNRILLGIFPILLYVTGVLAVCPITYPSQARAKIAVLVALAKNPDQFVYTYSLVNDPRSERSVGDWTIGQLPEHTVSASPSGWLYTGTKVGGGPGWITGGPTSTDLEPGQRVDGFRVASKFPPRIKPTFAWSELTDPEMDMLDADVIESPECENDTAFQLSADPLNNSIHGQTLGPGEISFDMGGLCDTFILDLIGQVREAAALGWIKHDLRKDDDKGGKSKGDDKGMKKGQDDDGDDHADDDVEMGEKDKNLPGAAKSIIKKLTKVRRECMRGKFGNAREKLRALIKQVNAQRGKHLTEEAYALIRFNAEFLLEKL